MVKTVFSELSGEWQHRLRLDYRALASSRPAYAAHLCECSWTGYEYDIAGRIVRQTLTDPRAPMGQRQSVTTWTYTGTLLTGINHPGQQERYTHHTARRVTTKTVTLSPADGIRKFQDLPKLNTMIGYSLASWY